MLSLKQDILERMPAELPDLKMMLLLGLKRILLKKKKKFFFSTMGSYFCFYPVSELTFFIAFPSRVEFDFPAIQKTDFLL